MRGEIPLRIKENEKEETQVKEKLKPDRNGALMN